MAFKNIFLLLILISFSACKNNSSNNNTNEKDATSLENFDWLLGDWKRTNDTEEKQTYESWKQKSNAEYIGVGFTMLENDTIWKENIKLINVNNTWNFEVIGQDDASPTVFNLIEIDSISFSCVNEKNEFPKKITYAINGTQLYAEVSGGDMVIPFEFEKIK